jgi:Tn3 transposase DDE domain-containing protein
LAETASNICGQEIFGCNFLVWNTVHMTRIIEQLRAQGETIMDDELARISLLAFAHVIPNGTYFARQTPLASEEEHNGHFGPVEMEAVDV